MVISELIKQVMVSGIEMNIPSYFIKVDSMQDDPEESVPFMCQTENSLCFAMLFPVDEAQSLPKEKSEFLDKVRKGLEANQGIIQVEAEKKYAYSIVKTLREAGGVVYSLNYQRYIKDKIINVQGMFEESGMMGYRDAVVYDRCVQEGIVGSENDRFKGWTKDPYDENYKQGALMNLSEKEEYDEMFLKSPLSMCRELVRALNCDI